MKMVSTVEKKPSKKMGASYKRSNKKQKEIIQTGSSTPIKPVNVRDDSSVFENSTNENSPKRLFPLGTYEYNFNNLRGTNEPEYSLKYTKMVFRKTNAENLINLELERVFAGGPRINVAINFSGGEVIRNPNVVRYFKILDSCGISKFISDSIQEIFQDIKREISFSFMGTPGYDSCNYPYVAKVVNYLCRKDLTDERIRGEFNSMDFSNFSKEVCTFIYNEKLEDLKIHIQRFSKELGNTVLNSMRLLTNNKTTAMLYLSSLISEISDALMSIFSGENSEGKLSDDIDKISVSLEEADKIKESMVNLVPERKVTTYNGSERYPK